MYGDKDAKRKRLERMVGLIAVAADGVRPASLARILGVARSTVADDLAALERLGVLLSEDEQGRVTLFRRRLPVSHE